MNNIDLSEPEALLEAHRELMGLLIALKNVIRSYQPSALNEVRRQLRTVQAKVTEHFRYEEVGGYFSEVLAVDPNAEHVVKELHRQHGELGDALCEIVTLLEREPTLSSEVVQKIESWMDALRHHEASENKLVQETFNLQRGGGD